MVGSLFLVVMFMGLFITPLVLGAYVVVGGQHVRVMQAYFGFITALFVIVLVVGVAASFSMQL